MYYTQNISRVRVNPNPLIGIWLVIVPYSNSLYVPAVETATGVALVVSTLLVLL